VAFFNVVATFTCLLHKLGVLKPTRVLERNLERIVKDKKERKKVMRKSIFSHFRYYAQVLGDKNPSGETTNARFRLSGDEKSLMNCANKGQSAILSLSHSANWDYAGNWANKNLGQLVTVVEKLKPPELSDYFVKLRKDFKLYKLGDANILKHLEQDLRSTGNIIALLTDRDLTKNGVEVQFFSEKISMSKGSAYLALKTNAPLFMINLHYEKLNKQKRKIAKTKWGVVGEVQKMRFSETETVQSASQKIADCIAQSIQKYPEDWQMMQKIFVSDLDKNRYKQGKL
jgi:KDO2-lipid IV(A) lauroyltransferase